MKSRGIQSIEVGGRLLEALEPRLADFDQVVIDTGGGIEASSLALVASADTPMIVLTPEPTSFVDAYAIVKALWRGQGTVPNGFVDDLGMADRPGFDLSRGGNRSPSFRTSEPWLVHNMWYLLAVSALAGAAGK